MLFEDPKSLKLDKDFDSKFDSLTRSCLIALVKYSEKNTQFFTTAKFRRISSVTTLRFIVFVADVILLHFRFKVLLDYPTFGPVSLKLKNFFREVLARERRILPSQSLALLLATVFVISISSGGLLGLFCRDNLLPLSTLKLPKGHHKLCFPLGFVLSPLVPKPKKKVPVHTSKGFYIGRPSAFVLAYRREQIFEAIIFLTVGNDFVSFRKSNHPYTKTFVSFFPTKQKDLWSRLNKHRAISPFGIRALCVGLASEDTFLFLRKHLADVLFDLKLWKKRKVTVSFSESNETIDAISFVCELATKLLRYHGRHREAQIPDLSKILERLVYSDDFVQFTNLENGNLTNLEVLSIALAHCFVTNLMCKGFLNLKVDTSGKFSLCSNSYKLGFSSMVFLFGEGVRKS